MSDFKYQAISDFKKYSRPDCTEAPIYPRVTWACSCGWSGRDPERVKNDFGCTINRLCPECDNKLYGQQKQACPIGPVETWNWLWGYFKERIA